MTTHDPISDMITRLRNALRVNKATVLVPMSKERLAIANLLKDQGYIKNVATVTPEGTKFPMIEVTLKYAGRTPVIRGLRRVSKPGQRIYQASKDLKPVLGGVGTAVVSTSKGLMSDHDARTAGVGGEVLFKVW